MIFGKKEVYPYGFTCYGNISVDSGIDRVIDTVGLPSAIYFTVEPGVKGMVDLVYTQDDTNLEFRFDAATGAIYEIEYSIK